MGANNIHLTLDRVVYIHHMGVLGWILPKETKIKDKMRKSSDHTTKVFWFLLQDALAWIANLL